MAWRPPTMRVSASSTENGLLKARLEARGFIVEGVFPMVRTIARPGAFGLEMALTF